MDFVILGYCNIGYEMGWESWGDVSTMFGGGEANYNISWAGLSPSNIFREHMAPLFSDLREERFSNWDNSNNITIINLVTIKYIGILHQPCYDSVEGCSCCCGGCDKIKLVMFVVKHGCGDRW